MKAIFSYKTQIIPAAIKDVDGKKGIVTGYFAKFDNVDADGDIIRKGAFTKSILETGPASTQPRIKHLLNHNTNQPLGVLMTLSEDSFGLNYESQIGSHALGQDFIKMVESDLITEHSIGYQTMKSNQIQDYQDYMKNPTMGMNELTDLKLWEGSSLTAWGANQQTPLTGLKTWDKDDLQKLVNRQKSLEKFCRNSTATDETIELLLIECKQLTQLIIENTKQDKTTSEPGINKESEVLTTYAEAFKNIHKLIKKIIMAEEKDILTKEGLIAHLEGMKTALETSLKTEVKADVADSIKEKMEAIDAMAITVKELQDSATKPEVLQKLQEDMATTIKAFDLLQSRMKGFKFGGEKKSILTVGEALGEKLFRSRRD